MNECCPEKGVILKGHDIIFQPSKNRCLPILLVTSLEGDENVTLSKIFGDLQRSRIKRSRLDSPGVCLWLLRGNKKSSFGSLEQTYQTVTSWQFWGFQLSFWPRGISAYPSLMIFFWQVISDIFYPKSMTRQTLTAKRPKKTYPQQRWMPHGYGIPTYINFNHNNQPNVG